MRDRRRILIAALCAAGLAAAWLLVGEDERSAKSHITQADSAAHTPDGPGAQASRAAAGRRDSSSSDSASSSAPSESAEGPTDAGLVAGRSPERAERPAQPEPESDSQAPTLPILVDPLVVADAAPTLEITGVDPHAPRVLIAWRVRGGRSAILARGESDRDGRLKFPPVLAPGPGMRIVVTAGDSGPGLPGASEVQRLPARPPSEPRGTLLAAVGNEYVVRIQPTVASGGVLLADARGAVFGHYEVPQSPEAAGRVFDIVLTPSFGDEHILMAHELSDGRRSEWRAVSLVAPGGE